MLSCKAKPHTRPPQNLSYVGGGVSLDIFLAQLHICASEMRRLNSTDKRKENQSQSGSQSKNRTHITKKKPKQKPTQQTKTNKQKTFDVRRAFYTDRYQEILGTALKRLFRILKKIFCIQKNSFVPSFKTSKISLKIFFTLPSVSSLTGNSLQSPTF